MALVRIDAATKLTDQRLYVAYSVWWDGVQDAAPDYLNDHVIDRALLPTSVTVYRIDAQGRYVMDDNSRLTQVEMDAQYLLYRQGLRDNPYTHVQTQTRSISRADALRRLVVDQLTRANGQTGDHRGAFGTVDDLNDAVLSDLKQLVGTLWTIAL